MPSIKKFRPSPGTIISIIALFVALSGVAYAATLPKNSVTTASIKSRAVTGDKIAKNTILGSRIINGTIKGKDILISTLPTVPSATTAGSWAVVTSGGQLFRNRNATSVTVLPGTGNYQVTFNSNVQNCVYNATAGETTAANAVPATGQGEANVAPSPNSPNAVTVTTANSNGTGAAKPFYLSVMC